MLRCFIVFLNFQVLFLSSSAFAEEAKLTSKYLNQFLGSEWKGILYACDPYCRFLSLREGRDWNPVLPTEPVELKALKGISHDDPVYPLLVARLPILPYRTGQGEKGAKLSQNAEADNTPPAYTMMPFNYGWEVRLGPKFSQMNSTSDTSVQSDFASKTLVQSYLIILGLMRAKPMRVFGAWFQQYLEADVGMGGNYKTSDEIAMSSSSMDLHYQLWYVAPNYKTGLRIGKYQETFTAGTDSISHYSTDQNMIWAGWAVQWQRFLFRLDTNLTSSFHDKQSFRQGPFEQVWYRAGLDYCSRNLSVFDISFGVCGLVSYQTDTQKSKLAPNVFVSDSSEIQRRSISGAIQLRFGQDFFQ